MPAEALVAGRLHKLDTSEGDLQLELLRNGKITQVHLEKIPDIVSVLELGDIIAVLPEGKLLLLAPQVRALPRRSYEPEILKRWNKYLEFLREFFESRDFLHVQTPSLVSCPGTEPSLDVFATELIVGSRRQKLFLPTSPELHLKKALALGAEKIYEIASSYRNGEITERHQPEFTMIEWYRAYDNLSSIQKDVVDLVGFLSEKMKTPPPREVRTYSVADLFKIYCDFELTPQTSKEELETLAGHLQVDCRSAESIDDYFFLIFMDKIERQLPPEELIFVNKYPPYQAALARLTEEGWGDRFEVYWQGYELANAFHELNDPHVQRLRSQEDLRKKLQSGKELVALDEEFFQCLEAGLPPSGGIALGVERLFMALEKRHRISDLKMFPYQ